MPFITNWFRLLIDIQLSYYSMTKNILKKYYKKALEFNEKYYNKQYFQGFSEELDNNLVKTPDLWRWRVLSPRVRVKCICVYNI